jgi:hypothetical protein
MEDNIFDQTYKIESIDQLKELIDDLFLNDEVIFEEVL